MQAGGNAFGHGLRRQGQQISAAICQFAGHHPEQHRVVAGLQRIIETQGHLELAVVIFAIHRLDGKAAFYRLPSRSCRKAQPGHFPDRFHRQRPPACHRGARHHPHHAGRQRPPVPTDQSFSENLPLCKPKSRCQNSANKGWGETGTNRQCRPLPCAFNRRRDSIRLSIFARSITPGFFCSSCLPDPSVRS